MCMGCGGEREQVTVAVQSLVVHLCGMWQQHGCAHPRVGYGLFEVHTPLPRLGMYSIVVVHSACAPPPLLLCAIGYTVSWSCKP